MAIIKGLPLREVEDGQFQQLYYHLDIEVSPGIGNQSDVYIVMAPKRIKVHTSNAGVVIGLTRKAHTGLLDTLNSNIVVTNVTVEGYLWKT